MPPSRPPRPPRPRPSPAQLRPRRSQGSSRPHVTQPTRLRGVTGEIGPAAAMPGGANLEIMKSISFDDYSHLVLFIFGGKKLSLEINYYLWG